MTFADQREANMAVQAPFKGISKLELIEKCAKTRTKLSEISASILMVQESSLDRSGTPNTLVKYTHRTARDYLAS